jgi:hypothetical protein
MLRQNLQLAANPYFTDRQESGSIAREAEVPNPIQRKLPVIGQWVGGLDAGGKAVRMP